ncbi:helix-turn-helix transcriptional regulator [Nocardiopsis sp. RSe5-2]|uniref:Helix-turn-helix transcriptional regulator n=1 Tax=Nocardiopsis endophytica TaxID=3018445 RepID=A0ABT4U065_9ACTN|nr:helix-turn-helix transcriptional regulator [Nocardiopsis endophytica]MDA2810340.1 helix-turn-helix transcriptional regulator [Nocardiopsis endophytica]
MSDPTPPPFGQAVRALLKERRMSVRELARRTNFDHGYLSRVLSGKQPVTRAMAEQIDHALHADGALAARASAPPPRPGGEVGDMLAFARAAGASDVGSGTVEMVAAAVDELCCAYPTTPGPVLRDQAKGLMREVLDLLERRSTLAEHRALLVAGGWLATLLGSVYFDCGDNTASEAARRLARQFGEQADHGEIIGWTHELSAWSALSCGRFQAVVDEAEAGRARAGASHAGVQLTIQEAKARARMGDSASHTVLQQAEAMLRDLPAVERPEHHFRIDPDKLTSHGATAYTWLGWNDTAEEFAREMAERYGPGGAEYRPMRLATANINLGVLAARRGDLDEAVALGSAALEGERRSGALPSWARFLLDELAARYPSERRVTDYRERLSLEW